VRILRFISGEGSEHGSVVQGDDSGGVKGRRTRAFVDVELKLGLIYSRMANAKLLVGKAAEAERYVQRARLAHGEVLRFLPLVDMLAGFQNALRRRRFKKLGQAVDRLLAASLRRLAGTGRPAASRLSGLEDQLKDAARKSTSLVCKDSVSTLGSRLSSHPRPDRRVLF